MRISDWSSDVCSSDLKRVRDLVGAIVQKGGEPGTDEGRIAAFYKAYMDRQAIDAAGMKPVAADLARFAAITDKPALSKILGEQTRADVDPLNDTDFGTENLFGIRSEEHTSELQSLMRNQYAVFCLKKKKPNIKKQYQT